MPAALAGPLARIRSVLSTISLGQKVVIGLLAVGLILGGFFFYNWITAPTYSPLFSNLASTDASAIVDELNAEGVSYQLADGGATIMVPNDQVYNLRLTMSGKGLPAGQDTGYSLLDQQGITTSEFQQQVTYQRAVEGELAKTLEAIKGVNTAVVHIALPKDQVFVADQGKPTASVLLDLTAGTNLSGEQISAVTNLVSSSIEGMDPTDVTVADSTGRVLSAAGTGLTAAAGDQRSQMEQEYENRLATNAQKILDQVVGPNHAVVSVRADLDLSQRQSTSETHSYTQGTPPLSESTSKETYSGTGTPVGGVLGPENTGTSAGGGNSTYVMATRAQTSLGAAVRLEGLVEEGGHRPARAVGHPGGDVALPLRLGDPLHQPFGDGELVLQELGGAFAQVVGERPEGRRGDPVAAAPSPGRDLLGPVTGEGLLGLEDAALQVVEHSRPGRRRIAAGGRPAGAHDGVEARDSAAWRQASRSGSTTLRQSAMIWALPRVLARTSSVYSHV
jgi:type III secretory pathway lipoprotein EscJ